MMAGSQAGGQAHRVGGRWAVSKSRKVSKRGKARRERREGDVIGARAVKMHG